MTKGRNKGKAVRNKTVKTTIPVKDKEGNVVLYDMYVNGRWIGSRSTVKQCEEAFRRYK